MASSVPRESRSPLSSPAGARAPERCSPERGVARVPVCPSREKPGSAAVLHVQPLPSAQPWQQKVSPSWVYPSPGHWFLIMPQPGQAGSGGDTTVVLRSVLFVFVGFINVLLPELVGPVAQP